MDWSKKFFELLRSHHHLENVSVDNDMGPPTFSWLTKYLGEVVRPAKITPETKTLLDGNAKNWSYTNRLILQDHYAQCIDREVDELQGLVVTNWSPAFTRAEKKYRNKYKKRHVREAIEKVKAILTALWDEPAQVPTPEQVLASEQASPPTEVNLQEERLSEDTEFPTTAPQPTFPTTTTPQFPPPRSPRAPRRNQVKGTAMGKRFAPSYANIFMAKWEEEALSAWPIKPLHYFRFLDDIWGVWKESEKEFK
ncbi:hypothetical protein QTP86_017547, partial [Hemibagrus guttatus]